MEALELALPYLSEVERQILRWCCKTFYNKIPKFHLDILSLCAYERNHSMLIRLSCNFTINEDVIRVAVFNEDTDLITWCLKRNPGFGKRLSFYVAVRGSVKLVKFLRTKHKKFYDKNVIIDTAKAYGKLKILKYYE